MTRMRFSGGIVRTVEKEVSSTDAGGVWELNDVSQRLGSNDYPVNEPAPPTPPTTTGRTATGALTDGSTVVLNDDGTVSVVQQTSETEAVGSTTVFGPNTSTHICSVYDPVNQKVVVAHAMVNYGTAVVGTVSGGSITFGTPVVFNFANTSHMSIAFDSNSSKVVVSYTDQGDSNYGKSIVGTVSGDAITFGTPATWHTDGTGTNKSVFDSTNNKIVIFYRDTGSGPTGKAVVGEVSGDSISFGTETQFGTGDCDYLAPVFDPVSGKVVISYQDGADSNKGKSIVSTVSGNSISFGTPVDIWWRLIEEITAIYHPVANRIVIAFVDNSDGRVIAGEVSGNSITFGPDTSYEQIQKPTICYDSTSKKIIIFYKTNTPNAKVRSGDLNGSDITLSNPTILLTDSINVLSATYDPSSGRAVLSYADFSNSQHGTSLTYNPAYTVTNLTSTNYLGISDGAYADGEEATIQIEGAVDDAQSGLIATEDYFVQGDGSIALTPDTPSVLAGSAVGPTKLLIKKSYEEGVTELEGLVASGALSDGSMVVLNSDGTVSVVAGTTITSGVGTKETFATNTTTYISSVSIPGTNKIVVAHALLGYGSAVVGTVSGNTITFGSSVVFNANSTTNINCVWDASEDRLVIDYEDQGNSSYGTAIVGSVSGDVITFGSKTIYSSTAITANKIGYDATNEKVVIVYTQTGPYSARGIVGVVSGTSITFGTSTEFWGDYALSYSVTFDPDSVVMLVVYRDANTDYGKAVVATVSGSSISFGSIVNFHIGSTTMISSTFDPVAKKHVVAYKDNGGGQNGNVVLGQVTGNTVSFSSSIVFHNADISTPALCFDPDTGKVVIAYLDLSTSEGRVMVGEVSGNSMTFESYVRFSNGRAYYNSITNQSGMNIISFQDYVSSSYGASIAYTSGYESTNVTATNFLGISDGAYADGELANIQTKGETDDAQSGLVGTQPYYVQADGTIDRTPDTPEVLAGTAISETEIVVKEQPADVSVPTTAAGSLSDGSMVVLNDDGTVSVVVENVTPGQVLSEEIGPSSEFTQGVSSSNVVASCAYDTHNDLSVVVWTASDGMYIAAGSTEDDGSISYGTPNRFTTNRNQYSIPAIEYIADSKQFIVSYDDRDNNNYGTVIALTLNSNKTFTSGTPMVYYSARVEHITIADQPTSRWTAISFYESLNNQGRILKCEASGNVIQIHGSNQFTPVNLNSSAVEVVYNPLSDLCVVAYTGQDNYTGRIRSFSMVGLAANEDITFNAETQFSSSDSSNRVTNFHICNDPTEKRTWLYFYCQSQMFVQRISINSDTGSLTAGSRIGVANGSFETSGATGYQIRVDEKSERIVVSYVRSNVSEAMWPIVKTASIKDTNNPSFGAEIYLQESAMGSYVHSINYDPLTGRVIFPLRLDTSTEISSITYRYGYTMPDTSTTNLTATNFLGVSDAAYADGEVVNIQTQGEIDDAQSGLTPGLSYHVQRDGSLNTTEGNPSVFAGTAIAPNKIIVKG